MTDYRGLLETLAKSQVEFIIVGGIAAAFHGSARSTNDVDVVYRRTPENMRRVASALEPIHPRLRGAPKEIPFLFDAKTIQRGLNFTLSTDLGDIDLLGQVTGGGSYDDLLSHSTVTEVLGISCRCVDIETLIALKRAAGRRKDFEAIAELELIRDRKPGAP
ncbi:MAG: hypothetical protein H6839_12435 [Planctomycetes bacterium]|nr:hypothetical protein [Planctomycetota bacterium]